MTLNTERLLKLDGAAVGQMSNDALAEAVKSLLHLQEADRKENQILFYRPASAKAAQVHKSNAKVVGVGGGNGSSKTETVLVEIVALATGVFPKDYRDDFKPKFRGPVNCRIVLESLTTTMDAVILPKLMWWKWTGVGEQGSAKGHWGWIPKNCLKDGSWDKSWNAKLRTLTILCRDPDEPNKILGESMIQVMSHDQDPTDFASGDFHHVMEDEPPRLAIWTENEARTMRVGGRHYLSMTWPDDPTIPVDWIFDKVYEPGSPGPNKTPDIDWFELSTTENTNLNQDAVRTQMAKWSTEMVNTRVYGKTIRFSNRIHPLFTDTVLWWSFAAKKIIEPENGLCPETGSSDIAEFCHVQDIHPSQRWPTVFLLDPHPRKPHMAAWVQIDANDDVTVIEELQMDADPADFREKVFQIEQSYGLTIAERLIDPNMGASPASSKRNVTWQDEFAAAGLHTALADDSDVGRGRLNEMLRPDSRTMRPRLIFARRCQTAIFQMKRYVWDNYRRADERDPKITPKPKNDDYPTLLKYFANASFTFSGLYHGAPIVRHNRGYDSRTRVRT